MDMHLESTSREAFELVTDALVCIDEYKGSRDVNALGSAKAKLASAKAKDPAYFRAHYFDAMVDDLAGRPDDAVATFTRLLEQEPPFVEEVRYNLGVAWYHHYNHAALDQAIDLFASVVRDSGDDLLQLLAHAGLAQAHAMHMIPKKHDQPNRAEIQEHFQHAINEAGLVLRELEARGSWWRGSAVKLPPASAQELGWTAHNARGMAFMYRTDYLPAESDMDWREARVRMLRDAVKELDEADRRSPQNWANYCDMASARMRLGYYEHSPAHFARALELLTIVVKRLRPDYGFAWYEIGRVLRLSGDFGAARHHFEQVLQMPPKQRIDIGVRRLQAELERAKEADPSFP